MPKPSGLGGVMSRGIRAVETLTFQHPRMMGRALDALRRIRPVMRVGSTAVVTRHALVREIIERDEDFTVAMYTPKMERAFGPFMLGMQDGPTYQQDRANFRAAVPHEDLPRLKAVVGDIVAERLASASSRGLIDVVRNLADAVPTELSGRYFGVASPHSDDLMRWSQAVFREFFYNIRRDAAISEPAYQQAELLSRYIASLIDEREGEQRTAPGDAEDVLGRMLRMASEGRPGVDPAWIRIYISGLIVGMLPLTSKASSLALDEMLRTPRLLEGARAAALAGDEAVLWHHISEAMRRAPQAPGQFRVVSGDQTIGGATGREYRLPANTQVLAATQAAMFDPSIIPDPWKVRLDRPSGDLFHFGRGLHTCFGRQLSERVQLPAIIGAVVSLPGLRRANGKAGRLGWNGPFPSAMELRFDA